MSGTLVTGASGFIGRPLLDRMTAGGTELHALCRAPAPEDERGVRWHSVDLADGEATARALAEIEPERLVHLAWYVEHGRFWSAPENAEWVERSQALLRAFAAAGGRRAVLVGTCAEYDWEEADGPLGERTSPVRPATFYGQAKDQLRRFAEAWGPDAGVQVAWARPFFFYGPHEGPNRLVPAVIRPLLAGETVATTEGSQRRDFLHVEDVAGGIVALLDSTAEGPVNVASGEAVAVADVVGRIAASVGRPELVDAGSLPPREEPPLLVADVTRLREEVGFEPRWTLAAGLEATIAWWRDQLAGR